MQKPQNFIDTHVHLWTDNLREYPLAYSFTPQQMKPNLFLPEDILRLARPSGVNRVILVQMSYYGFDNSYMVDVIRRFPQTFRGIAVIDWRERNPAATMKELAKEGIRGFRIYPDGASSSRWLDGNGFDAIFRCSAQERLAICPLVDPDALLAIDQQCQKFPDTPVIIDHIARIGMHGNIKDRDIRALCMLARHPHVQVKISAFYALGEKRPPHVDLANLISSVYEAFGPNRLMWGSDCPFQIADETYEDSISLIRDLLPFLSAEDKDWMLRRTAEELFFQNS